MLLWILYPRDKSYYSWVGQMSGIRDGEKLLRYKRHHIYHWQVHLVLFFPISYILVSFLLSFLSSPDLSLRLRFADDIVSVTLLHSLRGEDGLTPNLLHLRGS